jgi:hypothetical protein
MATKSKPADEPDLFSAAKHQSLSPLSQPGPEIRKRSEATLSSRLLPKNLASSLQQLSDNDFRRLLAAVLNEQKRRGKNSIAPTEKSENQREAGVRALSVGQLNVVRAAFKAGVKPTQIAKQFGLSKSQLRAALQQH